MSPRPSHRCPRGRLLLLALFACLTPPLAVSCGSADIPAGDVLGVVASHIPGLDVAVTWPVSVDAIVWQTRLPRVLTGLLVGAVLGVAGTAMQALVRNPLAEPYVLGVNSGAACGAACAMLVLGWSSSIQVGLLAFLGAMAATLLVLGITGADSQPLRLILAGLAIGFGFQSVTNLLVFADDSPEASRSVIFWMLGSLAHSRWEGLGLLLVVTLALVLVMFLCGPLLDALASGDATARAVGVPPALMRLVLLVPLSAAVGVAVASSGCIGFVGLVIPHIARRLVGTAHRVLVLASALAAGLFLTWTDTVARMLFSPAELPLGVITGLVGAVAVLLLVRRGGPAPRC